MRIEVEYASKTYGTPYKDYLLGIHREPRSPTQGDAVVLAMRCGMRTRVNKGEAQAAKLVMSLDEARQLRAALEHIIDGGAQALPRVIVDGASSWDVQVRPPAEGEVSLDHQASYSISNGGDRYLAYALIEARSLADPASVRSLASFVALRSGEKCRTSLSVQADLAGLAQTGGVQVMTVPDPQSRKGR